MAYCDYRHCAVCDAKAFYDAHIDWESQNMALDEWGSPEPSLTVLCADCAKTHEIRVVPKSDAALTGGGS